MLNSSFKTASAPVRLHADAAPRIHNLLEAVRLAQPASEQHFLKDKSIDQLKAHFASGNTAYGIFTPDHRMVACALLRRLAGDRDEQTVACYPPHSFEQNSAAVQAVAVHPHFGGHGLMGKLLGHLKKAAGADPDIDVLIAKVAAKNIRSLQGFAKAGFTQAAGPDIPEIDHVYGHAVLYFEYNFAPALGKAVPSGVPSHHVPAASAFERL